MSLAEKLLTGDLRSPILNKLSSSINHSISHTFPDTIPARTTHSLFISQKDFSKRINIYPSKLPGTESDEAKKEYYDLGAETINYWLLIKACEMVLGDLPPGISHGLKGLSTIYHLDLNSGFKELNEMGNKIHPENLMSVINSTLFKHNHTELTTYWNGYKNKKEKAPSNATTDDFILDIGRLAFIDRKGAKTKLQSTQLTPNWIGDIEAQTDKVETMLQPEWLKLVTFAELFGSVAMFALMSQPIPATILLSGGIMNTGLSVLDEIYKNLYMRSISKTDFGIRKIEWNNTPTTKDSR